MSGIKKNREAYLGTW